jgi:D-alanine--poly(phosphoribitol) ligase subunit 2
MSSMDEAIRKYLGEQLLIEFGKGVDDESDLFQLGLLDSYAYVELIRFLEREYRLRFTDDEILSNVVVSVSGLVSMVTDKVAA